MRVYLDVSCLNRPFDDQQQPRILLEAQAVAVVMAWVSARRIVHVASDMSVVEIRAIKDPARRRDVEELLDSANETIPLGAHIFERARSLESYGLKAADAVHIAAAEAATADVFLTCDDRLLSLCGRISELLTVDVRNPIDWVREFTDASNT